MAKASSTSATPPPWPSRVCDGACPRRRRAPIRTARATARSCASCPLRWSTRPVTPRSSSTAPTARARSRGGRLPPPRGPRPPRRARAPAEPCRAARPRLGNRLVLERLGRLRPALDPPGRPPRRGEVRQRHRYDRCHRRRGGRHLLGTGRVRGRHPHGMAGWTEEPGRDRGDTGGLPVRSTGRIRNLYE